MIDGDTCIICLQENKISNPLIEAKEIFETKCGCAYNVHKLCMDEWAKAKKKNFKQILLFRVNLLCKTRTFQI